MKHNWTYKKLGEVAISDLGKTLNHSTDKGNLYPYLCAVNVLWDRIDLTTIKQSKFEPYELERYSVQKGDLLICEGGDTGRAAIWESDEPMLYQNALHRVRFNSDVNARFVLYFLRHLKDIGDIDLKYSKGVTIKHLVKSSLMSIPLPIPSLDEQQAIVRELDGINRLIDLQEEQLREYDRLAQSLFYTTFGDPTTNPKGWEVKKLGDIGTFERGNGFLKKDFVKDGFPCIHYGQIHTRFGEFITRNLTYIPHELVIKSKIAHPGDVIIAITSEDLEGSCKTTAWLGEYDVAVGSHAAIFHHNQNAIYISYYTKTRAFYNEKEKYARGFKVMEIKPSDIAQIPIVLPPLALQQTFAAQIEAIEQQKALIRRSLDDTRTLLAARMQYYFE